MATHSNILAWEIPWTEEPGGLQSMGSQRVKHDQAHTHNGVNTVPKLTVVFFKKGIACRKMGPRRGWNSWAWHFQPRF